LRKFYTTRVSRRAGIFCRIFTRASPESSVPGEDIIILSSQKPGDPFMSKRQPKKSVQKNKNYKTKQTTDNRAEQQQRSDLRPLS